MDTRDTQNVLTILSNATHTMNVAQMQELLSIMSRMGEELRAQQESKDEE